MPSADGSHSTCSSAEHYFHNLVTGATQWADPGDCPFIDEHGNRYWKQADGRWSQQDPSAWKYKWVERWSEEHKRPYFYNQHTKASIWNRPADLAWVRVRVTEANRDSLPPRPWRPGPPIDTGATASGTAAADVAAAAVAAAASADVVQAQAATAEADGAESGVAAAAAMA